MTGDDLEFEPPRPGTLHLIGHFSGPLTRYLQGIYPETMQEATNRGHEEYGALFEVESAVVNGYWYVGGRPIVPDPDDPEQYERSPAELEAEYERRVARMAETFETRRWREDLERWDEELKPGLAGTLRTLQVVDPATLDDDDLLDYVERCRDAALRGTELHHRMNVTGLPVGDFLAHATEWTDRSADELVRLLDGASPASAGAVDELDAVVAAIEGDEDARRILASGAPPDEILAGLRARSGAVGTAVERWLAVVGYRLATGFDLTATYGLEQPGLLLRTVRSAVERGESGATDHDHEARLAAVREEVPARHTEEFDDLFAEARRIHRLGDEREIDLWAFGVLRRALLAVGRRLADRGHLHVPEHVVDLAHDELLAAFPDRDGPGADAVADRVAYRESHGMEDAPDHLGHEYPDPFEDVDLPAAAARAREANAALGGPEPSDRDDPPDDVVVEGYDASPGTYEGPARVVTGPDKFGDIQEGDVLVSDVTSTAFNVVLPLLGALVTDAGGMLSHPALVAREFGIPGVVGCEEATERIDDGDRIVVDGDAGEVRFAE